MSKTEINQRIRELQQELIRLSMSHANERSELAKNVIREISINRQKLRALS